MKKHFSFRLDEEMMKNFKEICEKNRRTSTEELKKLISDFIKDNQNDKP